MSHAYNLKLSDNECQALWRAVLEYGKTLELSAYHAPSLIKDEQDLLEGIKEKISLEFFFPENKDYPSDWD